MDEFCDSLQSCSQIYSHVESNENTRYESSSGQRMGKLEKILAWKRTKVRNKKEVIEDAKNKGRKVHFASLMDLCHVKNSDLEVQFQKYKGSFLLRGDIIKDDSGPYAVFIERGSSASQMIAATVMDIISRVPGSAGTSSRRSIRLHPRSKWKVHQRY